MERYQLTAFSFQRLRPRLTAADSEEPKAERRSERSDYPAFSMTSRPVPLLTTISRVITNSRDFF
jgi:hypothetical protein